MKIKVKVGKKFVMVNVRDRECKGKKCLVLRCDYVNQNEVYFCQHREHHGCPNDE